MFPLGFVCPQEAPTYLPFVMLNEPGPLHRVLLVESKSDAIEPSLCNALAWTNVQTVHANEIPKK